MGWMLLFGGVPGCDSQPAAAPGGSATTLLKVVCTTGMVADLARQVGGPYVTVEALMGPGVDPHLYKASPNDVRMLNSADLVLYSGLHLEGKLTQVLENFSRRKRCVAVTRDLPPELLLTPAKGFPDPHVWFDVSLWARTIDVVEQELMQLLPAHQAEVQQRAKKYRAELGQLHTECQTRLATLPQTERVLVTAHDAFEYFGRAYGLEVKAIQGINTETEAGVKEVNGLVQFLVSRKIPAVFIETSLNDRNIRSLVEGCQQAGHPVKIGGELYSDALGEAGTPAETYSGMIRTNVATLVSALQTKTP